jgi:hypothetical protein
VTSVAFLPCVVKKRMAKILYRALSDAAHGKGALPCKMLPCALCCAPRRKTHGKEFAVRFWTFAVRPRRTANPLFPVVIPIIFFIPPVSLRRTKDGGCAPPSRVPRERERRCPSPASAPSVARVTLVSRWVYLSEPDVRTGLRFR